MYKKNNNFNVGDNVWLFSGAVVQEAVVVDIDSRGCKCRTNNNKEEWCIFSFVFHRPEDADIFIEHLYDHADYLLEEIKKIKNYVEEEK